MDPKILAIAEELARIQKQASHLRLGQIISNSASPTDVFYVTDDALLTSLRQTSFANEITDTSSKKPKTEKEASDKISETSF